MTRSSGCIHHACLVDFGDRTLRVGVPMIFLMLANARFQARLEAGARHERRL
jgi:hypothetical protein